MVNIKKHTVLVCSLLFSTSLSCIAMDKGDDDTSPFHMAVLSEELNLDPRSVHLPPALLSSTAPNKDLIRQLGEKSIAECEETIRKFTLPANQSSFIDKNNLIKPLTQVRDHLQKLLNFEEESEEFNEYSQKLQMVLEPVMMSLKFAVPRGHYISPTSEQHIHRIFETAFNTLRDVRTNLRKMKHLSTPLILGTYTAEEPYEAEDVSSTALPSNGIIEEGEAIISLSDNVLIIDAKTDNTVITFEHFWIGSDAKVNVHLPSEEATISLYQRSGKPSFLLGQFVHEKGFLIFYSPYKNIGIPSIVQRMSLSQGIYQSKSARRYPLDFAYFYDHGEDEQFDRSRSHHFTSDSSPQVNFLETVEGKFEQAVITFNERFTAPSPDEIETCRNFLAVCQDYAQRGVTYADAMIAKMQNDLACCLYLKCQTLPFLEQRPFLNEALQLFDKSAEDGCAATIPQKTEIKIFLAHWLHQLGNQEFPDDPERAFVHYRESMQYMQKAAVEGSVKAAEHLLLQGDDLGTLLSVSARSYLKNPSNENLSKAKKNLQEAESLLYPILGKSEAASETLRTVQELQKHIHHHMQEASGSIEERVQDTVDAVRRGSQPATSLRTFFRKYPQAKNEYFLPLYADLMSNPRISLSGKESLLDGYPHPDLICQYLIETKTAQQLYLRNMVADAPFMKERAKDFFSAFIPALNGYDRGIVISIIDMSPYKTEDLIIAAKEASKKSYTQQINYRVPTHH